jgi:flagellar motor switch protein FliG
MQMVIRVAEKDKLPIALKGSSDVIRDLFFKNLSERAAKMLRDDMEQLGPIKLREVDEAQASIVLVAKELASSGQIEINQTSDDDMVY